MVPHLLFRTRIVGRIPLSRVRTEFNQHALLSHDGPLGRRRSQALVTDELSVAAAEEVEPKQPGKEKTEVAPDGFDPWSITHHLCPIFGGVTRMVPSRGQTGAQCLEAH